MRWWCKLYSHVCCTNLKAATIIAAGLLVGNSSNCAADQVTSRTAGEGEPSATIDASPDFRLISGPEAVVPISVEAGAVIVEVTINGRGPFPMMFDTGSQNSLTLETAAALGLEVKGAGTVQDSGDQIVSTASTRVATVRLGNAEMTDQQFTVIALPPYLTDRGTGRTLAGLIGSELLDRFVVRLDYDNSTLTLHPGWSFRYDGKGDRLPLILAGNNVAVPAAADGIAGRFLVDTGSTGALTLRREFVEDHDLDTRHPAALRIKSIGVGGPFEAVLTRLDRFDIAGSRIDGPATRFPSRRGDGPICADFEGMIGYEILRQFVITFDYPRHELWLERSSAFGAKTGQGTAGFQAVRVGGVGFSVTTVVPSTAAAAAGLRVGDLISEINGQSTASMSTSELVELMRRPAGTLVRLHLVRGGAELPVALTLSEVLPTPIAVNRTDGVLQR
jgi:predicted aspartyl protease